VRRGLENTALATIPDCRGNCCPEQTRLFLLSLLVCSACSSLLVSALDELHQALAVPDWILSAIAQQIVIHVRAFCDCLLRLASDSLPEGGSGGTSSDAMAGPSECRLLAVIANCSHFRTGANQLPRVWKRLGELFADGAECGVEVGQFDDYRIMALTSGTRIGRSRRRIGRLPSGDTRGVDRYY
jgi:hypothetical protein